MITSSETRHNPGSKRIMRSRIQANQVPAPRTGQLLSIPCWKETRLLWRKSLNLWRARRGSNPQPQIRSSLKCRTVKNATENLFKFPLSRRRRPSRYPLPQISYSFLRCFQICREGPTRHKNYSGDALCASYRRDTLPKRPHETLSTAIQSQSSASTLAQNHGREESGAAC